MIEALICWASVVDRNAVSTLANEIQSLLLCRLCGSCQRREPFLLTCFTLKAITSLNRLNLKARECFMERDKVENKPTNRRKGARKHLWMLLSGLKVLVFDGAEHEPLKTCQQLKGGRKHGNAAGKQSGFTGNFLGICKCRIFLPSGKPTYRSGLWELLKATLAPQEGRLLWKSAVNLWIWNTHWP